MLFVSSAFAHSLPTGCREEPKVSIKRKRDKVTMPKVFLYAHGGSGNHGCEAIVRSTIKILDQNDVTLISSNPDEDRCYGLDQLCRIVKDTNDSFSKRSLGFVRAYAALKIRKNYIPMEKLRYREAFGQIHKGDIALSIGGDNYCYADVQKYVMLHNMLIERGAKTVLWGCSVEPEVAKRPEIMADLKRYDLITARETITYEALKAINPNTVLVPDPAFLLDTKETKLPEHFIEGNTVGINLSPMAIDNEKVPGMAMCNYEELMKAVLSETDMNIAFIPHVVWAQGDDRVPLHELFNKYKKSSRVCIVDDRNCEELKQIISKCRFFVGARTHATIAAYSTGVPTLVLGYSVKARGIAKDLFGTEDGYVISVQNLASIEQLLTGFRLLCDREAEIKKVLIYRKQQFNNQLRQFCQFINQL